jgi:glycosyltransferase involved in cell wall biosynthesis
VAEWSIAPVLKTGLRKRNGGSNPSLTAIIMKVTVILPDSMSSPTGGLGVQFNHLYKELSEEIDFCIVGYPDDNPVKNYVGAVNPIPQIQHGSLTTLMGQTIYLAEAIKFGKPDVVHAYDWSTYLAGYYLAKHFDVPLLLTMQLSVKGLESQNIYNCADPSTIDGRSLHNYHCHIEDFVLKKADRTICVSDSYTRYLPKEIKNKTVVIPNGIDLPNWKNQSNATFPGKNKYKIVYIGRFAKMKGVDLLLKANLPDNIDLILIGKPDGGDVEVLDLIKNTLKFKSNIFYVGPLYDQNKIDTLYGADAVIMPSIHEPFGIVALEALASKSILLSSRVDGMSDFLTNKNSIHITPGVKGIEKALNDFIVLTESQKTQMIYEGIKTCKKHNWNHISKQYLKVYKSLK